jgi:BMC domain
MAFSVRIISHPSPGVFEFLRQRVGTVGKKIFAEAEVPFTAVGLIQGKVVDMIAAADVAEKAADVRVFDLKGICPQHITMIGIFGDIAEVKASIAAVEQAEDLQ